MKKLTDLEICKRIAEIEGFTTIAHEGYECCSVNSEGVISHIPFNPLKDNGLCFQLIIKYKVRIHWLWEENDGTPHYEAHISEDGSDIKYDKAPNKAICLAIIEANK